MNKQFDFIVKNNLPGSVLRELVWKGLWKPALSSCEFQIKEERRKLQLLRELRRMLREESKKEGEGIPVQIKADSKWNAEYEKKLREGD